LPNVVSNLSKMRRKKRSIHEAGYNSHLERDNNEKWDELNNVPPTNLTYMLLRSLVTLLTIPIHFNESP